MFGHVIKDNNVLLEELQMRLKYLNDNEMLHPSFESTATLIRVKELLRTICERISFNVNVDVDI